MALNPCFAVASPLLKAKMEGPDPDIPEPSSVF
jgi:hypothetical protein